MSAAPVRWGALVATYRRPETALTCVRLLLEQTRTPDEIIVVAAEGDDETREDVFAPLRPALGERTRFVFVRGPKGLTRQRNAGIAHVQADACLFLDDDCFAPRDFVERLMRVFDADAGKKIGGVAGIPLEGAVCHAWWAQQQGASATPAAPAGGAERRDLLGRLRGEARRWLDRNAARYVGPVFPPRDFDPRHPLPAGVTGAGLSAVSWLPGGCTAYRADVLRRFRFCEAFAGYAAAEDVEFSYRVGRHYCLVRDADAILYHMQVGSGRPDHRKMAFASLLNLSFIARTAMTQGRDLRAFVLAHHARAGRAHLLKGVLARRGLGEWQASRAAARATEELFDARDGEVEAKYLELCARWERSLRAGEGKLAHP